MREKVGPHWHASAEQRERALEYIRFPYAWLPRRGVCVQQKVQLIPDIEHQTTVREVGGDLKFLASSEVPQKENRPLHLEAHQRPGPEGAPP